MISSLIVTDGSLAVTERRMVLSAGERRQRIEEKMNTTDGCESFSCEECIFAIMEKDLSVVFFTFQEQLSNLWHTATALSLIRTIPR